MNLSNPKRFPALQASMGDWVYYVTTLPFSEVAERVMFASELINPSGMSEWIQRSVIPRRASQIADYLINQEQHLFPCIVVGVYLGEPTWYEIDIEENLAFGHPGFTSQDSLGILELDGNEKLYAIDGQHRVAGIKEALCRLRNAEDAEAYQRLADERLSIVFVAADVDKPGHLERVRRLFTTLNKEAKRVSLAETIALDEDDSAAIVTRRLVTHFEGLNRETQEPTPKSLVQMGTRNEIQPSNRHSITTIVTLYRFVKRAFQPEINLLKRQYKGERPDEERLFSLYEDVKSTWKLIGRWDPAVGDVLGSDPSEERASRYRGVNGGHILFRPVGLQAFAGALGMLRKRDIPTEYAVQSLSQLPKDISRHPWKHVLWNPNTRRMVNNNGPITEALFLYMLREKPRSPNYDLLSKYRAIHGRPDSDPCEDIPILGIVSEDAEIQQTRETE